MSTSTTVSAALDTMFERKDGLYGTFEDLPVISQAGHARRVELLERLDIGEIAGRTVVDFGMGSWGFASIYPRLHGCGSAIGMDISNAAIALSNELISRTQPRYANVFQALQSDGMNLPLPDESVDVFFSGESIEHVKFPLGHLSEIYRTLKPGGQLIITTPNRDAVKYKEQGEEYCTSPEHFWLFNYEELVEAVSRFFEIKEAYGFNGSFGSHEEDRTITERTTAEEWSRRFEAEPHLATGIVLRVAKRPGIQTRYEITDIPQEDIAIEGADTYLDLEFGLRGLLLDQSTHSLRVKRPPSDGVVCRFWSHRWSGLVNIEASDRTDLLDLYTFVPGWKNWFSASRSIAPTEIHISPSLRKNAKAESTQTLFFEAFVWREIAAPGIEIPQLASPPPASMPMRGYGFERLKPFVGTTVFHWFEPNEGNVRGPWQPLGGRATWTGKADFWKDQIKQMMLANIDAIYLHCIDLYEGPRIEFFKAYAELRREGYDVPKVAPFLDPNILFGQPGRDRINVATEAGKDEFTRHYIRFFDQYFSQNDDSDAASYLLTVDGRLVLSTWWVCSLLLNVQDLQRSDVERRLSLALGSLIPQLRSGIYMITTAMIDPDLSFADERMVAFSGYAYAIHSVHKEVNVWHVQPGYWDQNIRKPGYLLPRDGGKNYQRAWDAVAAAVPHMHRVYIESWNEYDEGSGIYAADPGKPFVDRNMHSNEDRFSDADDPYEYVLTTAEGAAKINGRPAYDARLLWHDAPQVARRGEVIGFSVVMRNEGNKRWLADDDCALVFLDANGTEQARFKLGTTSGNAAFTHGVFRGAPLTFNVTLTAPSAPGPWQLIAVMTRQGVLVSKGTHIAMRAVA